MKTYNQFLNTSFSEEVKPEPPEEDNQIKSKEKRQMQIKKQVLLKKMQAVRAGAGADIVAGYEPEGEELKEYSPNVTYQAKGGKKSGKLGKSSVYSLKDKGESKKEFRKSQVKDIKGGYLKTEEVVNEGDVHSGQGEKIQKRTKAWMDKKGQKGAPGLDAMKARTAEHKAKRGVKEEVVLEKDTYTMKDGSGKKYTFGTHPAYKPGAKRPKSKVKSFKVDYDPSDDDTFDPHEAEATRGQSGKGTKGKMNVRKKYPVKEGTDKAFEYVKKQIAAKYGKSGYVSKDNPRKPQSSAEKAKVAAHKAKLAKQDHRDPTEKASDGRYSDRYSNRGSD